MPLRAIALRFIFVSPGRVYFLTAERRRHKEALRRSITGRGLRSLSLTLEAEDQQAGIRPTTIHSATGNSLSAHV
jgi:hypothetical protein